LGYGILMRKSATGCLVGAVTILTATGVASVSHATDRAKIMSVGVQKCLSVIAGDTADVTGQECIETPRQSFSLIPLVKNYFNIVSNENGECLAVVTSSADGRSLIDTSDCNGFDEQMFSLKPTERFQYHIASKQHGLCFDMTEKEDGGIRVALEPCNGSPQQSLKVIAAE